MKQKENQRLKFVTISIINTKKAMANQHLRQCQKRGNSSFFFSFSFFLTNSFKCISPYLSHTYITLGKEGTQCKHITTMIKLSITRIAVWDKLLVLMVQTNDRLFSKRIEHFYTLINTARNCQKLINNCAPISIY